MNPNSTSDNSYPHVTNYQGSYKASGSIFAGPVTIGNNPQFSSNNYVAPLPLSRSVFKVPEMRNHGFVERNDVFLILESSLEKSMENNICRRIILTGLGGMGKTQIALEYCYRSMTKYPYIFWMEADTEAAIQTSYVESAKKLNLPISVNATPDDFVIQLNQWLESNGGWLLVFDNADDYSLGKRFDRFYLQKKYLPKIGQGVILVTTRNEFVGHGWTAIRLDEMRMDDMVALKLLLRENTSLVDDPYALEIIRELGHLPLAIDLAGACMRMGNLTPAVFLDKYRHNLAGYQEHALEFIQGETGNMYGKSVLTVWNVSFDHINGSYPLAASLLQSLAFLHPDNIPYVLFERHAKTILNWDTTPSNMDLTLAISKLRAFSLVRVTTLEEIDEDNPIKTTLTIHRLVQTVVRLDIKKPERLERCKRLILAFSGEMPSEFQVNDQHFLKVMKAYIPHIQHGIMQLSQWVIERRAISNELTIVLLPTVAYLKRQASFDGIEGLAKLAVESSEIARGQSHKDTATALSNLSYFYASQGDINAALPHYERALAIRKEVLGSSHRDTIASLHDLAYIYQRLGEESKVSLLYLDAAQAGDRRAQKEMARRYQNGIGVPINDNAAVHWLCLSRYTKTSKPFKAPKLHHFQIDNINSRSLHHTIHQTKVDSIGDGIDITPLHYAVHQADIDSIQNFATNYKQWTNVGDRNGQNPLHWAARIGCVEIVRLLVMEFKANTSAKDIGGQSPLHEAAANGHAEVVKLFVSEFRVDVDVKIMTVGHPFTGLWQMGTLKW